ncbi:MAG: hypothetical protein HDS08_06560 [Bacteroides sp.]|nr:hypothetical protein [Barnesiella sp.]MBD5315796.1 hypothetical protein [Bacteroides sp.]
MRSSYAMFTALLGAMMLCPSKAEGVEFNNEWMPEINGTLRPRYEWSTSTGDMRFQVRNARVSLNGKIAPIITYRAEVDLCQLGAVRCLDVWGRIDLSRTVAVQVGQMRMPFTLGSYRPPHVYLFANRPFTDKQVGSPRQVGAKGIFQLPKVPFSVEAGVFNTSAITNHSVWQEHLGYAGKVRYILDRKLTFLAGAQSLCPLDTRVNDFSGAVSWDDGRFLLEGEYVYRHPTNDTYSPGHAFNIMGDYKMNVKVGYFNRLSFQARWDGMTDMWDGTSDAMLPARNRVTLGTTLSYVSGGLRTDLRLNFEQCFYHHGVTPTASEGNKLVAEMVIRF